MLGKNAHWTLTEVLDLDHAERVRWVNAVAKQVASSKE